MVEKDRLKLELIAIKRLTYGDLRDCIAIYKRSLSIFNRLFCLTRLPESIRRLKNIAYQAPLKHSDDYLEFNVLVAINECFKSKQARACFLNANSDSDKIFTALKTNAAFGKKYEKYKSLLPEDRLDFLITLRNELKKQFFISHQSVKRNLEGLEAIASGLWYIQPKQFNIFKTFSDGDIFLDTDNYSSLNEVNALINHIFDIYYTGYQLAKHYDNLHAYFDTFSGWDCLAASSRNLTKWIIHWQSLLYLKEISMDMLMERIYKAVPEKFQDEKHNEELVAWFAHHFNGVIVENKPVSVDDFRKYLIEVLGFSMESLVNSEQLEILP